MYTMAISTDVLAQVIGPLLHGADACRFGMTCKELYATYLERVPPIQRAFHILEVLERAKTMNDAIRISNPLSLMKCRISPYVGNTFSFQADLGEMHGFSEFRCNMICLEPSWNDKHTTNPSDFHLCKVGKYGETLKIKFSRHDVLPGFKRPGDDGMEWWLDFTFKGKRAPKLGTAFKLAMIVLDLFRKYNPQFANVHVGSLTMTLEPPEFEGEWREFFNTPCLYKALASHGVEPPSDAEADARFGPIGPDNYLRRHMRYHM